MSNLTRVEFRARMMGEGSLRGVSMKRLGWREVERACRMVPRMVKWRVRRMRVLRDW